MNFNDRTHFLVGKTVPFDRERTYHTTSTWHEERASQRLDCPQKACPSSQAMLLPNQALRNLIQEGHRTSWTFTVVTWSSFGLKR